MEAEFDKGRNGPKKFSISRRALLKGTAGTAALLGAVKTQFPFGLPMAHAAAPETTKAVLGYIALMDASPLVIAKEKGLLRQARHAGCRSLQAGVLGRDARQPRARFGNAMASMARIS